MAKELMFAYGTLKRGYRNHYRLLGDEAKFVGTATSVDKFQMYAWGFPLLIDAAETWDGAPVSGEIFEVPRDLLRRCDQLEGHPIMYRREKREFNMIKWHNGWYADKAPSKEAWVYIYQHPERFADDKRDQITPNGEGVLEWQDHTMRLQRA